MELRHAELALARRLTGASCYCYGGDRRPLTVMTCTGASSCLTEPSVAFGKNTNNNNNGQWGDKRLSDDAAAAAGAAAVVKFYEPLSCPTIFLVSRMKM